MNVSSWISQFIGHAVYEHRAPALLDNPRQGEGTHLSPSTRMLLMRSRGSFRARAVLCASGDDVYRFWL